jgi:hypothetical protein
MDEWQRNAPLWLAFLPEEAALHRARESSRTGRVH